MFFRHKLLLLSLVALFFGGTLFFGEQVLSRFIEFSLRNYCKNSLCVSLKEESVTHKDRFIVFENPFLTSFDEGAEASLIAEQLILYYEPNFFERRMNVYVTLVNPKVDLSLMKPFFSKFFESEKESSFFQVNHHLQVSNGILKFLKDGKNKEIYFSLDHDLIKEKELNLKAYFETEGSLNNSLKLKLFENNAKKQVLHLSLKDLCCKTLSHLLTNCINGFPEFEVTDGILNGDAGIAFGQAEVQTVSDLVAKDLSFSYKPLSIYAHLPSAHFRFSERNRGQIDFKKAGLSFKPEVSIAGFEYNQLIGNGSLDFNLLDHNKLMTLKFTGEKEHLVSFFPDIQKQYVEQSFMTGNFLLKGSLKKLIDANTLDEFFSFEGELDLISDEITQKETICFGFELEEQKSLNREKLSLQNGWFRSYHLNLEKYMAPFIFQDNAIKLSGYGDLEGSFDREGVHVSYSGKDVSLENSHFLMEVDQIFCGEYSYSFKDGKIFGKIPVSNGTYFEKNHGLYFTDIKADFEIEREKIRADAIEVFCNGAYFTGSQELDLSFDNTGEFDLNFHITGMKAKFSQAKAIFSHFNKPYFFLKMPLEADMVLRQEGAFLNFQFKPDDYKFFAAVQGEIENGTVFSDHCNVSLQDLSLKFDYTHFANDLSFSDIQGTLFVGKPNLAEEYLFAGDHVRFTDYSKSEAEFDLWVGDKNRDMIRVVGKTSEQKNASDLVEIALDLGVSHFGEIRPELFTCILKNWSEIDTLNAKFSFQLEPLLNDLQRFSRTGFFFLSKGLLKELNALKNATGDFLAHLEFDKTTSHFNYELEGKKIKANSYQFDEAFLKGTKSGPIWSIEEFKCDKFSLSADILHQDDTWKINFLGAKIGSSLLVGLEGEYVQESNAILAEINFCEANFENLKEFAFCKGLIDKYSLKGNMRAKGELKIEFGKGTEGFNADVLLNASLSKCRLKNFSFEDVETLSCHYVMDKGIVLRGIETKALQGTSEIAHLNIEKVEYGFQDHSFSLEGVDFKLPSDNLKALTSGLEEAFIDELNTTAINLLKNSKTEGFFEGSFNLDISKPFYALRLSLKDGFYHAFGKVHHLQDFVVDFDPCEFKLLTKYGYDQHPFWLSLQSKSKKLEFGKLLVMDEKEDENPLTVYWRRHSNKEFTVEGVEGSFCGLYTHLFRDSEKPLENGKFHLTGDISFDFSQLNALMNEPFLEKLKKWKIGAGYALKGNWSFFNGKDFDLFDSKFEGDFVCTDFDFKGYQFQGLLAKVDYKQNCIKISDFHLEDSSGNIYADSMKLAKDVNNHWRISVPFVRAEEIRPSLVRKADTFQPLTKKPLVISQLELECLEGDLENFDSLVGYGRVSFKNPHKKNLQNTILAIPSEIISRIGLDLTVLTPVIGTIEYQILDGKVLLNKFKDVYSEGRLSKFYLADSMHPSYVDFDGNLFVKVRMKHYNLLFKLAEMFVVNVQGNLKKPTYTFHKQQKQQHEVPYQEAI